MGSVNNQASEECGAVEFLVPKNSYEKTAKSQKAYLDDLAEKIRTGAALNKLDMEWAAGAIRAFARSIPDQPKGKQGSAPKFCRGSEALVYASLRVLGNKKHGEALAEIAERVEVSEQAVEKGIKKYRTAAFAWFDTKDPGNQ